MRDPRTLAIAGLALFLWSDPFSITLAQVGLVLSGVCWAWVLRAEGPERQVRLPLIRPYLVFAAVTVASVFVSRDPWRSLLGVKSLWLILAFYLAANLVTSDRIARRLLGGLLVSVAGSSLVGLWQTYRFGLDYRIRGTLSIYMTVAGILVIVLLLALTGLIALRGRPRLLLALLTAPMCLAFALTYTRNAWLGFVIGAMVLAWSLARRWAPAVVALVLVVPLLAALFIGPVATRVRSMADLSDMTFVERVHIWRAGLRMIREHPLLGVGIKMPERLFPQYRDPEGLVRIAHLHNDVLQITAERGVIGLASWLAIWISFFAALARLGADGAPRSPFADAVRAWSRASAVGVLVAGLFQYNFGDSEILMLLYFAMGLPFGLRGPPAR